MMAKVVTSSFIVCGLFMNITVLLNRYDSREGGRQPSLLLLWPFLHFLLQEFWCGVDISLTITHCGLSAPACGGSLLLVDFSTCLFPMNKSDSYNITLFFWIECSLAVVVVVSCVANHTIREPEIFERRIRGL